MKKFLVAAVFGFFSFAVSDVSLATSTRKTAFQFTGKVGKEIKTVGAEELADAVLEKLREMKTGKWEGDHIKLVSLMDPVPFVANPIPAAWEVKDGELTDKEWMEKKRIRLDMLINAVTKEAFAVSKEDIVRFLLGKEANKKAKNTLLAETFPKMLKPIEEEIKNLKEQLTGVIKDASVTRRIDEGKEKELLGKLREALVQKKKLFDNGIKRDGFELTSKVQRFLMTRLARYGKDLVISDNLLAEIIRCFIEDGETFIKGKDIEWSDINTWEGQESSKKAFFNAILERAIGVVYGERNGKKKEKLATTRLVMDKCSGVIGDVTDLIFSLGSNHADVRDKAAAALDKTVSGLVSRINGIDDSKLKNGSKTRTSTNNLKGRVEDLCHALSGPLADMVVHITEDEDSLVSVVLQLIAMQSLAQAGGPDDLGSETKNPYHNKKEVDSRGLVMYYLNNLTVKERNKLNAGVEKDELLKFAKSGDKEALGRYIEIKNRINVLNKGIALICKKGILPSIFEARGSKESSCFADELRDMAKKNGLNEDQTFEFLQHALYIEDYAYLLDAGLIDGFKSFSAEESEADPEEIVIDPSDPFGSLD